MKRFTYFIIAVLLLAACSPVNKDCVAVCGGREVRIIDWSASNGTDVKVLWRWHLDDPQVRLPEGYDKYMQNPDDCKFVDGGKKLLVTASGDGMMLLDIRTKEILHYAHVPMAHSADLLPGGRIAVALSTHEAGNALEIYDIDTPEKCVFRDSLYSGHGVVWNARRESLFALGYKELREYKLEKWNTDEPSLRMVSCWEIPLSGGHDLSVVDNDRMLLTASKGVHVFDINTGTFTPFEPLKDVAKVKSVNYDPKTSRFIYTKGEISWWTHNIYQFNLNKDLTLASGDNPVKVVTIDSMDVYKVRPAMWR